jgi:hypothetical protein
MGFLKIFGDPLNFEESKQYFDTIRKDALNKIIDWISNLKDLKCCPKSGFEVSFFVIK